MKFLKSVAILSLASLFAFSTAAQANTSKNNKKTTTKQQQVKKQSVKKSTTKTKQQSQTNKQASQKKASTAKKAAVATAAAAGAAALTSEQALALFNDSFGIKMLGYKVENNDEGKTHLHLRYELSNKGNKEIKAVKFISALTHNNQIVYAQEIPLTFNTPLKAQEKNTVDMMVPFESIPEVARPLVQDSNVRLGVVNGAQTLVFSDNTGIEIK